MPGRKLSAGTGYRYGFNGKENDNEVKGEGAQQDYGLRIYDPRLSKFLSVDPLAKGYPMLTPYQFASNNPTAGIDMDGGEFKYYSLKWQPQADGKSHLSIDKQVDQVNRSFRTSITVTGLNHPTVIIPGSKYTPPIFGLSNQYTKNISFGMEDLGMTPSVVSPDGKTWKVVPSYMDLNDLPALNDPIWNTFESTEQYVERFLDDANKIVAGAQTATQMLGILQGSIKNGKLGASKAPRYDGPKPAYKVGEHGKKAFSKGLGKNKTPLPDDAEDVYKNAVPDDPIKPNNWYGINKDGTIYRYGSKNSQEAHFNGRSDYGDGIRNYTDYAKERLKEIDPKVKL